MKVGILIWSNEKLVLTLQRDLVQTIKQNGYEEIIDIGFGSASIAQHGTGRPLLHLFQEGEGGCTEKGDCIDDGTNDTGGCTYSGGLPQQYTWLR